jgi:hypothetical protein
MIVVTFTTNHRTRKLTRQLPGGGAFLTAMSHGLDSALVGYLVACFFVTVLHYPFFWINFAFTVSLYHTATQELRRSGGVPVAPRTTVGPQAVGLRGRVPQRISRAR